MWASVDAAKAWNARVDDSLRVAPETALRLPNAIAGSIAVLGVYVAAGLLFEPLVGLTAAFFVAADPTVISVNRLGKEDTFLMMFFILAVACYESAKVVWAEDARADRAARWLYNGCGICFGLMLASKYMPHLWGLYGLFNLITMPDAGSNAPRNRQFYPMMAGAFLIANFAVLLPDTWRYVEQYIAGGRQSHHGHLYDGRLYVNAASVVLWGVPWTYYFRMIATKMPLVVLAASLAGLPLLVTRRHERGLVWLRVFIVIQMLGYAVIAAKFQRYAMPLLIVIDILAAVGVVAVLRSLRECAWLPAPMRPVAATTLAAAVVGLALQAPVRAAPHFSVYRNAMGARAPATSVYPEEAYDFGVREAVAEVSNVAGAGAAIVSDADMVVEHYLQQTDRRDLVSRSLSRQGLEAGGEQWVLVQDNHLSFENASLVAQLPAHMVQWRRYSLEGATALEVFKVTR
jgi:4-amino-4-deoxy-L-arabinose transferase-like glycosyltransferase